MDGPGQDMRPWLRLGRRPSGPSKRQVTMPTPPPDPARDGEEADRRTSGLAAIVVVLLLLIGGLMLTKTLHNKSVIEDCLIAGRRNCDQLVNGGR